MNRNVEGRKEKKRRKGKNTTDKRAKGRRTFSAFCWLFRLRLTNYFLRSFILSLSAHKQFDRAPVIIIIIAKRAISHALINVSHFLFFFLVLLPSQILSRQFRAIRNAAMRGHLRSESFLCHHEDRLSRVSPVSRQRLQCNCRQCTAQRECCVNADSLLAHCICSSRHLSTLAAATNHAACHPFQLHCREVDSCSV